MIELITMYLSVGTDSSVDPLLVILTNGGVVGAIFILSMFGKGLHTDDAWKELKAQNAEKDRVITQLMTMLQIQVLPAMEKSTQVIEASTHKETALVDRLTTLLTKIEDSTKEGS